MNSSHYSRIEDALLKTAIYAIHTVADSKAIVNELASELGVSQYDAEKAVHEVRESVVKQITDIRVKRLDRKFRKLKVLQKKLKSLGPKFEKELQNGKVTQ